MIVINNCYKASHLELNLNGIDLHHHHHYYQEPDSEFKYFVEPFQCADRCGRPSGDL